MTTSMAPHQGSKWSFQLPEPWRQNNLTRENLLSPELKAIWFSDVECVDCHELLLRTIRHFTILKKDYIQNYSLNSDCSALKLLFAQSLPHHRFESALSYEVFKYGEVILNMKYNSKRQQKQKHDSRNRALQAIIGLYTAADNLGLAGSKGQRAFAASVDKLLDVYIRRNFGSLDGSGRSSHSVLPALHDAIARDFVPLVSRLIALFSGVKPSPYYEDDDMMISDHTLGKWQVAALDKLGQIRSSQILDILSTLPKLEVIPAPLRDLRDYLVKPSARKFMTAELVRQLHERYLHPAASTVEVLAMYMVLVEAFRETDPSGVVIHRVSAPIRSFLMSRDDAVRIIISSLLEDSGSVGSATSGSSETFCSEIADVMRATVDSEYSEFYDGRDLTDIQWLPDPADAVYGHRGFNKADRMSHLITLEEKSAFIKELQNVLGERLLRSEDYNFEKELQLLKMFKMRFEEYHITQCEIMLRDALESQRIDQAVNTARHTSKHKSDPDFHAKMISKYYWPALRDETFILPKPLATIAEHYAEEYRRVKTDRRLEWLNALGRVFVELELTDRTVSEEVATWQAAVIYQFHSDHNDQSTPATTTVAQIIEALEMDEYLVRAALTFWVGKLVIRESVSTPDTFTVLETLSPTGASTSTTQANTVVVAAAAAAAAAAQAETSGAGSSTLKSSADLLQDNAKIYSSFIVGMLTNQGAMPAKRVHMMLKMVVPGGFPFEQEELVGFMNELVKEEKIERSGVLWKIVKKAV